MTARRFFTFRRQNVGDKTTKTTMNTKNVRRLAKILIFACLAAIPVVATAGGGTYTGTGNWNVSPPSAADFLSYATSNDNGPSCFATCFVINISTGVYVYKLASYNGSPANDTGYAGSQPADNYTIVQEVSYSAPSYAGASTTVSW
jgi:hypothetical protein